MTDPPDEHLKKDQRQAVGPEPLRELSMDPELIDENVPPSVFLQLPRLAGAWWRGQLHCPFCLKAIETTLIGLSTQLGPSLLQCRKCGQLLISHRREWADRTAPARLWYIVVSLIHVAVCAALAFGFTLGACILCRTTAGWFPSASAVVWSLAIAGLQAWRVRRSMQRTATVERLPYRPSFWSLDFYLPEKVLVGLTLSAAVLAWLASFLT